MRLYRSQYGPVFNLDVWCCLEGREATNLEQPHPNHAWSDTMAYAISAGLRWVYNRARAVYGRVLTSRRKL
ncbi:hypothetical protein TNCT_679771 [Trichonephila clavata]|uniref:Uncharacterized protein n=1 Tax=Trichonephila clavata TaxID=2740835 RepID=A0A8X6LUR8_TRICU|nr:hypothetical protein TNCT_679771 [Trichonephila clavata]